MRGQSLLVAGAVLIMTAISAAQAPAAAQNYYADPHCRQQQQNRMVAGAVIGGLAGAVLGNNVAADNAQTEGTVLGGVVGAAAGAAVGRASANCQADYGQTYGYDNRAPDPYYNNSGNYGYGYSGAGYGSGYGYGQPQACRWGEQRVRDRRGRWQTQDVYLCQGADGVWRAQ